MPAIRIINLSRKHEQITPILLHLHLLTINENGLRRLTLASETAKCVICNEDDGSHQIQFVYTENRQKLKTYCQRIAIEAK